MKIVIEMSREKYLNINNNGLLMKISILILKTYNNTSEDFRAQGRENRSHESNPASFVLHQYRPHHLNTNRSPDPRRGKCPTSVFPLSEERFDCTTKIKCIGIKLNN